jgi:dolichol kinase
MRITAAFDPAPYIYPTLLPVIVALCLFTDNDTLLPNLILGLACVPRGIVSLEPVDLVNPLHWILTLLPSLVEETLRGHKHYTRETFSVLYLVHAYLTPLIYWISTTSLLPAELELLSVALIDVLFLSKSPVSKILSLIIWVGGLGILVFCAPFIRWGVALARIPRWRLKRTGRIAQARQSFIKLLNQALHRPGPKTKDTIREVMESDADDDNVVKDMPLDDHLQALKLEVITSLKQNFFPATEAEEDETRSAVEKPVRPVFPRQSSSDGKRRQRRRHTIPSGNAPLSPIQFHLDGLVEKPPKRRKRRFSASTTYFLSLTYEQAVLRKWVYAVVIYGYMILIILLPVRYLVSRSALGGAEPFGWAIGYLFGDLRDVRFFIVTRPLFSSWIPLPPLPDGDFVALADVGRGRLYSKHIFGEANTRLMLAAWCFAIIVSGLAAVWTLDFVEVDTRRKVFHGMMVAMLLPSIFVDPCFIALALIIVLAIFLILDLLRAGQVPPVSKPIAQFLAPYVDGRDLKGPVVISHVFLLIGCAVPLWLSLSAATFITDPSNPWNQWDVQARDLGMVAGVVCVGMGDAMASLIGRRYGRHKWPWSGGKSFEGSFAFATAVTLGLVVGKAWLLYGQWADPMAELGSWKWGETMTKAAIAGCAVSGMEAALTGGNDNVVVPLVLWIMVRILDL